MTSILTPQERESFKQMKIEEISIENKDGWSKLHESKSTDLYMSWEYCQIINDKYELGITLLCIENGNNGVMLTYAKRSKKNDNFDLFTPYGMGGIEIWGDKKEDMIQSLSKYLGSKQYVSYYLLCSADQFKQNNDLFKTHRTTYNLNLNKSVEELWKGIHKNHKYEIKKIKQDDFKIIYEKSILKDNFTDLYEQTILRVNASSAYSYKRATLQNLINSNISELIGACINNKIVCVVLFIKFKNKAEYFINASTQEGRFASRKLIWEMIVNLKEQGIETINLGGGVKEGDFLDDFKRRFGGKAMPMGKLTGVVNHVKYDELCKEFCLHESTDYFPPYWA